MDLSQNPELLLRRDDFPTPQEEIDDIKRNPYPQVIGEAQWLQPDVLVLELLETCESAAQKTKLLLYQEVFLYFKRNCYYGLVCSNRSSTRRLLLAQIHSD